MAYAFCLLSAEVVPRLHGSGGVAETPPRRSGYLVGLLVSFLRHGTAPSLNPAQKFRVDDFFVTR